MKKYFRIRNYRLPEEEGGDDDGGSGGDAPMPKPPIQK